MLIRGTWLAEPDPSYTFVAPAMSGAVKILLFA